MTDNQFYAHRWLSRMWYIDNEIDALEKRRDDILASLSGIGKYDSESVPGDKYSNVTESRNIEYSILCDLIDKKQLQLSSENIRTLEVLNKVTDTKIRGMLIDRYLNRESWEKIGKKYYYEKSSSYNYRKTALDVVFPFVPKEVLENGD